MTKGKATVTFPNGATYTRRTNNHYLFAVVVPYGVGYRVSSMHTTRALAKRAKGNRRHASIISVTFHPAR